MQTYFHKIQTWCCQEFPISLQIYLLLTLQVLFICKYLHATFWYFTWAISYFIHSHLATLTSQCFLSTTFQHVVTVFVIPVLTDMAFKLLSAGWHLIKIWDLHLSWGGGGGGLCRCLCAQSVLIFCSSAGPQRVQQMFPSVPVLRRAAVWGPPQRSQDSHVSLHGPLLICNTGTFTPPGIRYTGG